TFDHLGLELAGLLRSGRLFSYTADAIRCDHASPARAAKSLETTNGRTMTRPLAELGGRTALPPLSRCLVPGFDGALFGQQWKDARWTRFSKAATARHRLVVE